MENNGDCLHCKSFGKSIFSCLEKSIASKIVSSVNVPLFFRKGQDVYTEGNSAKGVFCIQSGKVKVYKNCEGRNLIINLSCNSDLIGYTGIFNGGTFVNSAKCIEDSHLCFIPKKAFLNILSANPEIVMALLKQSCQENAKISNYLKDLKCTNMLGRITSTLLEINKKFGTDENKNLNVNLTRKEIGEISGTTTESAIRILNQLKKEKVITLNGSRIRILDINKLQRHFN